MQRASTFFPSCSTVHRHSLFDRIGGFTTIEDAPILTPICIMLFHASVAAEKSMYTVALDVLELLVFNNSTAGAAPAYSEFQGSSK